MASTAPSTGAPAGAPSTPTEPVSLWDTLIDIEHAQIDFDSLRTLVHLVTEENDEADRARLLSCVERLYDLALGRLKATLEAAFAADRVRRGLPS